VLIVEDESYLAEAIRDGLRLEAITADIAGDGVTTPGFSELKCSREPEPILQ
jgi:DNA-binding response OmpR family regulator